MKRRFYFDYLFYVVYLPILEAAVIFFNYIQFKMLQEWKKFLLNARYYFCKHLT